MGITLEQINTVLREIAEDKVEVSNHYRAYLEALIDVKEAIKNLRVEHQPEIVYCRECKNCDFNPFSLTGVCDLWNKDGIQVKNIDYCSFGAKRES